MRENVRCVQEMKEYTPMNIRTISLSPVALALDFLFLISSF